MPYIKQEDRLNFLKSIHEIRMLFSRLEMSGKLDVGKLNYIISIIIHEYLENKGLKYNTCNDIMGVMESAKAEFYRRVVAPYEDLKIQENGDI